MEDTTTYEVTLTTFTYGGDAMGRLPDNRAVFVPFGLPGEKVRIRLTQEKKNFARGEIVEILESSPDRINAKCKHFTECGGCHYQNLPYEKQLAAKKDILIDQLKRIGKIDDPPVQDMVACPDPWNYRNHIQFSLDRDGKLGFVGAGLRPVPTVIPITECHLPESSVNDFWPQLEFEPGTNVERVSLRAGVDDDLMLVLESETPEPPELEIEAGISVTHVYEENTVVIAGNDHILMRVLDRDFKVSAASFFQVNTVMAGMMVEHLAANLPVSKETTLLDVYCGVGLFSAFFAPKCKTVIGIESSESSCDDFTVNLDEFDNVELYDASAEDVIPHFEAKPDIVLVDPPRAGLDKAVLDRILKLEPSHIAYVSCDPSTLARDAARLINGGYKLKEVTPFDLFPQTYHIESISIFER
ncbi:MAG TPA: class I SAM-dependent RNA methyltransferase [Anaerolineales bacterium]|nr:class I SAM-dependent RNA methyltransferase [Anaerolineales bacterium]